MNKLGAHGLTFTMFPFSPLIFFLVLTLSETSCRPDQEEIARVTVADTAPVERIKGLETLYSDSGLVKVRVRAPEYQKILVPESKTLLPSGIHIEFFDARMKVESELKAQFAVHFEEQRIWEARKDVEVVNRQGERLNTEKLVWDERRELLSSDEQVKITTGEEIIYGEGFEANQDFSKYRIFNVKGRITLKN